MPPYSGSPQEILDLLHTAEISSMFEDSMPPERRLAAIKDAKQRLKLARQQIRHQKNIIRSDWVSRPYFARKRGTQELKPFELLENLISAQIEVALVELEIATKSNRAVPNRMTLPSVIIGDSETGEWIIGSEEEVENWLQAKIAPINQKILSIEQQIASILHQNQVVDQQINSTEQQVLSIEQQIWTEYQPVAIVEEPIQAGDTLPHAIKKEDRRISLVEEPIQAPRRQIRSDYRSLDIIIVLLLMAVLSGAMGTVLFFLEAPNLWGIPILVFSLFCFLVFIKEARARERQMQRRQNIARQRDKQVNLQKSIERQKGKQRQHIARERDTQVLQQSIERQKEQQRRFQKDIESLRGRAENSKREVERLKHLYPVSRTSLESADTSRTEYQLPQSDGASFLTEQRKASKLSPKEFEREVARVFELLYPVPINAEVLGGAGDGGIDIKLYDKTGTLLGIIQAKKHDEQKALSPSFLRDLDSCKRRLGVRRAFLVTTARFSVDTSQQAKAMGIDLVDGTTFEKMQKLADAKVQSSDQSTAAPSA
jgi:hypothetical protein